MDKKIMIGIVAMLLIVGLIAVFVPSNSNEVSEVSGLETDLGSQNADGAMGDRPQRNEDGNDTMPPMNVDGEAPPKNEDGTMPPMQGGNGMTAPQEAIDACSGLSEGDSCSFATPRRDMDGTCSTVEEVFACNP